jgi:hypothetical protein
MVRGMEKRLVKLSSGVGEKRLQPLLSYQPKGTWERNKNPVTSAGSYLFDRFNTSDPSLSKLIFYIVSAIQI